MQIDPAVMERLEPLNRPIAIGSTDSHISEAIMDKKSATGRDGMIIAKALCYAIASIDALPADRREASDRDDMVRLLRAGVSRESLDYYAAVVESHTGCAPDLRFRV